MFPCHSLNLSHPLLPRPCPRVCSLCPHPKIPAEWWTVTHKESACGCGGDEPSVCGWSRNLGTQLHFRMWHLPVTFFICNGRPCISSWHMLGWKRNIRPVCVGVSSSATERVLWRFVLKLSTSWSISPTSPVAEFFLTLARMLISCENLYWWMRWRPLRSMLSVS